jgi:hypothetical protein
MGWFRSNLQWNCCLALIALAIQLSLTFAHVAHDQAIVLSTISEPLLANAPAPTRNSDGLIDLFCPLCAAVRSSAAAATSSAPILPLPADPSGQAGPIASRQIAVMGGPLLFSLARGPPSFVRPSASVNLLPLARIWSRAKARPSYRCIDDYKCGRHYARTEQFRAIG